MKKIISLVITLLLVVSMLWSCSFNGTLNDAFDFVVKDILDIFTPKSDIVWEEKIYWTGTIEADFVPGELIVGLDKAISEVNKVHSKEFFKGVKIESIRDLSYTTNPDAIDKENFHQVLLLVLVEKTKEAVMEAMKIIEKIDGVRTVHPNGIYRVDSTVPNDPLFSFSDSSNDQWALETICVEKVWEFTTCTSKVRVGVIDTGISPHEDLINNYQILDDDGNYKDILDFCSYDKVNQEPGYGAMDEISHGTHVAGIIGAEGNNNIGISGINWDVSIVQMKVGSDFFSVDAMVEALNWATEHWDTSKRISIINFSGAGTIPYAEFEQAIRDYCDKGGVFICATGNEPQDNDSVIPHVYPAFYGSSAYGSNRIPNIISVGRSDINDERSEYANWGLNTISIFAPGDNIISTIPLDMCGESDYECYIQANLNGHREYGYHYKSGSSMSAPHVSGVAALLLSVNPNLTASQIKQSILCGADEITITTGDGGTQLVKRLNAWGAFKHLMKYYPLYQRDIGFADATYLYDIDANSSYMINNTAMMKFNIKNGGNYTFNVSSLNPIAVKLYDSNLQEIVITQTSENNGKEIEFTCLLSEDTYYIRTNYINAIDEGTISVYVNCPPHAHQYTEWQFYSDTHHIEKCCECGQIGRITGYHVIEGGTGAVLRGKCIYCKSMVLLGNNTFPGIMSVMKYSVNGSYILPSGVIVLVDEDIEAYLNGTLVFYDKNNLPVTQ